MKILAIDSSACAASVAIMDNEKLLSEFYLNVGLTHSQTLMPLVSSALECAGLSCTNIDLFVVTNGPGSFTGVRIGVAAIKGLAQAVNRKCVGVSTLEAMAYNLLGTECIACCVMDARCEQVYTAMFLVNMDSVCRITQDSAMKISELSEQINKCSQPVVLVGDGAQMCYDKLSAQLPELRLAPEGNRYQRASGAALASKGVDAVNFHNLGINYLRLPQAERELKKLLKSNYKS